MYLLIVSLLAISFVSGSFGAIYPIPQPILTYSTFQPAENQFNPPAVPFNPQTGQFNPPAGQFNPSAGQFNPTARQFNQPSGQFKPPTGQFNPPAGQFNPPAGQFNPSAGQLNPPAVQFPSPVSPRFFDSFEPNYQIPTPLQASVSVTSPSRSGNDYALKKFNKVVKDFGLHFIRSLLPSKKYTEAFNLKSLSKEKAVSIFYERVGDESARAGDKDPDFSAYSASRGVKYNYDAVNSEYHMKVYGFGLGEFLYQRGVLTADNVIELSDRLSQTMRDNIDANANPSSEDNLVAIIRGCGKYLTDLNLFGANEFYDVNVIISFMWYYLRECYEFLEV